MVTKTFAFIFFTSLSVFCCQNRPSKINISPKNQDIITCNNGGCYGTYVGPEFTEGSDVAHQFSNQMAGKVGAQLKKLFQDRLFSKVDLKNIKMETKEMDQKGDVQYNLAIPFITVADSCEASTAFDHRGGWGHIITLKSVLETFESKNQLEYIEIRTPEGLQEFWLQWRHSTFQKRCFK